MPSPKISVTPSQIRAGRALIDWSQDDLAKAAKVSLSTVRAYEAERRDPTDGPKGSTIGAAKPIREALEAEGVIFLDGDSEYGPGVRLSGELPNVLRWPVKLGAFEPLQIPVEWRGNIYTIFLGHDALDDLGRFRESQPDAEYLRVYENHRRKILTAASNAIDAQRFGADRRVHLTSRDFFS